jgi:coenzyme F420 hydrogenase subunit beta
MLPASPALARVARGDLCAGCGACAALAPDKVSLQVAPPGYLRPVQSAPLSASEEAGIAAVCPGLGQTVHAAGRLDPVLWGPYVSMQTGWATDEGVRHAGSSGGALSMILIHLLRTGVVDAVVQTGAAPDLVIGNATVVTASAAEVTAAAGSRYAPSAPLADLPAQIATGKRFAFVGKPCDAAALRAMQARDPKVAAAFPVVLSFFCAGVPSHAGGKAVLAALGTDLDKTARFRFRGNGWPGRAAATQHDQTVLSMSYHDSWGKILSKHVQHRCKICADGTGVAADIVCADAWESDAAGYPVFEESPGISLIVARTALGADLVARAQAAGDIEVAPFDVSHFGRDPARSARAAAGSGGPACGFAAVGPARAALYGAAGAGRRAAEQPRSQSAQLSGNDPSGRWYAR